MRVVVVGAGPAGLATALALAARDLDVVVLERANEVGGRVRTLVENGRQIELGPAGILDDAPDTMALLRALGADAPQIVHADPIVKRRYLVRDGVPRALPSGPAGALFGRALRFTDKLGVVRELFARRGDASGETIAAFARRRVGAGLAASLIQPMVAGVFGGDYETLELISAFPRIAALEAEHNSVLRGLQAEAAAKKARGEQRAGLMTFAGGMGALPRAMAKPLGDRIYTSVRVLSIERRGQPSGERDGARFRVVTSNDIIEADRVVIATEAEAAATLIASIDPRAEELMRTIGSVPIASVSLGFHRTQVGHALDGFGLLVPRRERMKTMGVLFMTSIFPDAELAPSGDVLLRVMLGGVNDPDIAALDDAIVLDTAEREVGALLGISTPAHFRHVYRWPRAIAQYTLGHAARIAELETRMTPTGVALVGTALRGVGVNDVLREAARVAERIGTPG